MRRFALLALSGLVLLSCSGPLSAAEPKLDSEDQKTIYALGFMLSRTLHNFRLDESELEILIAALRESIEGKDARVDLQAYATKISLMAQSRRSALAEGEKVAAVDFLKKSAAEEGAVTTESGMIFLETQTGSGESPAA